MKLFDVIQNNTLIAEGVEFSDGRCAVNWKNNKYKEITGLSFYDSLKDIHEAHDVECRTTLIKDSKITSDTTLLSSNNYKTNKTSVLKDTAACLISDPNRMCIDCTCWKQIRKNCS